MTAPPGFTSRIMRGGRDMGAGGTRVPLDILGRGRERNRGAGGALAPALVDANGQRIAPSRVVSISPATEFPIPTSQMFFGHAQSLVLAAAVGATVTGPTFQLTSGNVAVLNGVTIFENGPDTTTNIFFTLLINGSPVPGFDALSDFPRVANNLDRTFPCAIVVPNGALISMIATNRAATGPWTVGMDFIGYQMTERDVEAYTGMGFGRI